MSCLFLVVVTRFHCSGYETGYAQGTDRAAVSTQSPNDIKPLLEIDKRNPFLGQRSRHGIVIVIRLNYENTECAIVSFSSFLACDPNADPIPKHNNVTCYGHGYVRYTGAE